jgi:hypothetical protein
MQNSLFSIALILTAALLVQAHGQEATPAPEKKLGWSKNATLGANLSFTSSQSVVGQTDGASQTYGTSLKGAMNHLSDHDEWRNSLSILASTTRTPSVPRYVKSSDEAKYETLYLYPLPSYPKVGPYAKGEVAAPMFKGEDVRAATTNYRIVHTDASEETLNGTSLRLTDGFKPMNTKEGVGFLWKALDEERIHLETRAGFGALQIDASGQYAVGGANDVGEIVVNELSDVNQAGLELGASAKGKIEENSGYEFGVETLTPFINNKKSTDKRDAVGLTNVDAFAKLSANINKWASFGYDYKLKIQPQLQAPAQQIHMLVVNLNHNLF